jgi:hypothetical protein
VEHRGLIPEIKIRLIPEDSLAQAAAIRWGSLGRAAQLTAKLSDMTRAELR